MDVSIIIVNYKTCNLVVDCIKSIYDLTKKVDFEIIVVDNNSDDGSVETIISLFPQVQVIPLKENIGFGKANNVGVKRAQGKYVCFLNSDTVLLNDAISILVAYLDKHEFVALCGGQLFDATKRPTNSYMDYPDMSYFLSLIFKGNVSYKILPSFPEGSIPYYISGADMMLRKSFIDRYGAFDPDFFMYYEDTELSYRVEKLGFGVHFVPEAQIMHLGDQSPKVKGDLISKLDLFVIQSRYLYLKKTKGEMIMKLLLFFHRIKADLAIVYYYLLNKRIKIKNWIQVKEILKEDRYKNV